MHESSDLRQEIRALRLTFLIASFASAFFAFPSAADDVDPVAAGRSLFRIYCATCHGAGAKGDGTTAAYLTVKPADLTKISRSNGGEFPADEVRKIIDGREVVRGHGEREMPLWGLAFQDWAVDRDQEQEVRDRIDKLVRYLESIQKK